ncbi:MAG: LysR family transcriptional regulator [Gammaproteobacteria bacterium]
MQNRTGLNWDDFRIFLAVADNGSLSGAARELRVTHSTVFRRINAMEERVGVTLFEREASGYALTLEGEEVLEHARRMETESELIEQKLSGGDLKLSGTIRVATMEGLAMVLLPAFIKRFREEHPEIRVDMVISSQVFNLSRKEADVAIRMGQSAPPEHLTGRRIGTVSWAVYGAPAYFAEHGKPGSAEELKGHQFVSADSHEAHRAYAKWTRKYVDDDDIVYTSNVVMAQRSAAREGIGLVVLPRYLGESERRLERAFDAGSELDLDLWVLTHPDLHNKRVDELMDFIGNSVKQLQPMLNYQL